MILGIGETVLDIIFKNDQPQAAVPGGSTFNAIISLGRAGCECAMLTETGSDHVGDITCKFLIDNGVSDRFVCRQPGTKSHISLAFLNEQNDACYQFYKDHASAQLTPLELAPWNLKLETRNSAEATKLVLLFGSFFAVNPAIRDTVAQVLQSAHDAGAMLYYDVNFRAPHRADLPVVMPNIEENMRLATIVRGSNEDFALLYDMPELLLPDTAEQAVDRLYRERIAPLCPIFICTSGADSIYLRTPSLREKYPVAKIPTVSTIGAGDNFNAGLLYELQKTAVVDWESKEQWQRRIASGQLFAQDVCRQLSNSISPELAATLK